MAYTAPGDFTTVSAETCCSAPSEIYQCTVGPAPRFDVGKVGPHLSMENSSEHRIAPLAPLAHMQAER